MSHDKLPTPAQQEHQLVDSLLPWYVNQSLSGAICVRVAAHVQQCRRCCDELALLRTIHTEVGSPPIDAPVAPRDGLDQLLARIKAQR